MLDYWFQEIDRRHWFKQSDAIDHEIRERFEATYWACLAGETADWRNDATGRLAEIIVLDQWGRNMFRGTAQAFNADPVALVLAQELLRSGGHREFSIEQRSFALMPFMHSESRRIHELAVPLFAPLPAHRHAQAHKDIIDRFGRYPHRNNALGRASTAAELNFMKTHAGF